MGIDEPGLERMARRLGAEARPASTSTAWRPGWRRGLRRRAGSPGRCRYGATLLELLTIYKVDNKFYPFDLAEHAVDELAAGGEQQSATLLDTQNVQLELQPY